MGRKESRAVKRVLTTAFTVTNILLLALVLAGCGGRATETSGLAGKAEENLGDSSAPLAGTTPGRPALVEFYADW